MKICQNNCLKGTRSCCKISLIESKYNDRNKAKDRLRRVDLDKLTKEEYWTGFRLMRCVATFCSEIKIRPFSYCS